MNLIKQVHRNTESLDLIVEACRHYNISSVLLESLDGVLHTYIQKIKAGQMANFNYNDIAAIANIFALSSMIGVTDASGVDTTSASDILHLYKNAMPGDGEHTVDEITKVVDELNPEMQAKVRNLANVWGKSLSHTIQHPTPQAMNSIANRLLKTVTLMKQAVSRLDQTHSDNITKAAIQASGWRNKGVLSSR